MMPPRVLASGPKPCGGNKLVSLIKGPLSWYGLEGQTTVESRGVRFTFSPSNDSGNGTSVKGGQFPAFIFS